MSTVVKGATLTVGVTNPNNPTHVVLRDGVILASVGQATYPSRVLISAGVKGDVGEAGDTILSGFKAPSAIDGDEGDYFIDLRYNNFYGPKIDDSWGSPTSMIGPQGDPGEEGPPGPAVPIGIEFIGEWDTNVSYTTGQMVSYLTLPYFALSDNQGFVPLDNPTYWSMLSIVGPQGPQGPEGPPGATGADGLIGLTGDTGPAGPQGPVGPQGIQGPEGIQGEQGLQGVAGPQGIQGLEGADGPEGPIGPQGIQGVEGPEGIQGIQGVEGPQGPEGPTSLNFAGEWDVNTTYALQEWVAYDGLAYFAIVENTGVTPGTDINVWGLLTITGPVGPAGPQGEPGIQGPQGVQGVTGPQGIQGESGVDGLQGIQGEIGPQGIQGPEGPQGIQGEVGPIGPEGPIGETGVAGPAGAGCLTARMPEGITSNDITFNISTNEEWPVIPGSQIDFYNVLIDNELMVITGSVRISPSEVTLTATRGAFSTSATSHKKNSVVALRPYGIVGAQGIQGEIGPQGIQGIQGEQGIQGIQGEPGVDGVSPTSIFDVHIFFPETLPEDKFIVLSPMGRNVEFPANFLGSFANASTAATVNTDISILKNNVECGAITFLTGSTSGALVSTGGVPVSFSASDTLSFICAVADDTLADVGVVLAGTRA